jgi:hypothetical protein
MRRCPVSYCHKANCWHKRGHRVFGGSVAAQGLASQETALPSDFIAAHKNVVVDKTVQFSLADPPEFKPPAWLKGLKPVGEFIEAIAPFAKYIFWGILALFLAIILYYILREFSDFRWPWRKDADDEEAEWVPDAAPARALLGEADALAANGKFEEAAHLLLLRSVEDIEARRPKLLKPSSTAREIAAAAALPEKARTTFALITRHVESSLFGGRSLDEGGWQQCREAYGRFALAGDWR